MITHATSSRQWLLLLWWKWPLVTLSLQVSVWVNVAIEGLWVLIWFLYAVLWNLILQFSLHKNCSIKKLQNFKLQKIISLFMVSIFSYFRPWGDCRQHISLLIWKYNTHLMLFTTERNHNTDCVVYRAWRKSTWVTRASAVRKKRRTTAWRPSNAQHWKYIVNRGCFFTFFKKLRSPFKVF